MLRGKLCQCAMCFIISEATKPEMSVRVQPDFLYSSGNRSKVQWGWGRREETHPTMRLQVEVTTLQLENCLANRLTSQGQYLPICSWSFHLYDLSAYCLMDHPPWGTVWESVLGSAARGWNVYPNWMVEFGLYYSLKLATEAFRDRHGHLPRFNFTLLRLATNPS